jgi:hypothetical protein
MTEGVLPSGTIQLYDRYVPGLAAGAYQLTVTQAITGLDTGNYLGPYAQAFTVTGPRFALDPTDLGEVYPPADSNGVYGSILPSVVLNRRTLPWERAIAADPTIPWLALLAFQPGEVVPDPATGQLLSTSTVAQFLTASPGVLVPAIAPASLAADVLASTVTSVVVPLPTFTALAPSLTEAALLAHARQTDTADQADSAAVSDGWYTVVIGNRFPDSTVAADGSGSSTLACLVSLEGLTACLPGASGGPVTGTGSQSVRLAVLASWSFVCNAADQSFAGLTAYLAGAAGGDPTALLPRIPVPAGTPASAAVTRLAEGYAPLAYHVASGEDTFAWYRGPLAAVVPQPMPAPADGTGHYATSAEVTIYLEGQGVFDTSYAAAFEAGRLAALADRGFAVALVNSRSAAYTALATVGSRLASGRFAASGAQELLAPRLTWQHFGARLRDGMGADLSEALAHVAGAPAAQPPAVQSPAARPRAARAAADPVAATRALLARDDVRDLLAAHVTSAMDPVTDWLAQLALLHQVPFRHLVPDERMLPVESVRFFYLDPGWTAALTDGALSIGVEGSRDLELQEAWSAPLVSTVAAKVGQVRARRRGRPDLAVATAAAAKPASEADAVAQPAAAAAALPQRAGMLLRSALVAGWPGLVVQADGGATPLLRLDLLSGSVLLAIFDGVPGTITLGEPWHGLRFGVQDGNVLHLRSPSGVPLNVQFPAAGHGDVFSGYLRPVTGGVGARVLAVASLASALPAALGPAAQGVTMGAALFATELVSAPQQIAFSPPPAPPSTGPAQPSPAPAQPVTGPTEPSPAPAQPSTGPTLPTVTPVTAEPPEGGSPEGSR